LRNLFPWNFQNNKKEMGIEEEEKKKKPRNPLDTRLEIVHLERLGHSAPQVSERVKVATSTCNEIYLRWKQTSSRE